MKNIKISLILNIIIVILVTIGNIFMFAGITFMPNKLLLQATKLEMLKFYTVDSNILVGIISFILIIFEIRSLKTKKEIPNIIYTLKLIGTTAITLTFLVTAFFLTPRYGIVALYSNSNLFFHFCVPVLALISYICFEKHENKYRYALLGIIPTILYSFYYIGQILIHLNSEGLTYKYDFYGFLGGEINNMFISIPVVYLITYLSSLIIIRLNKIRG